MNIMQKIFALALSVMLFASESAAIAPYCVADQQFGDANSVYLREGRTSCPLGEHYTHLPGDIFPTLTTADLTLQSNMAVNIGPNEYYRDIIVPDGATVTIPSGTVFRCYRNFINHGTINVSPAAAGSNRHVAGMVYGQVGGHPAHPGLSFTIASDGDISTSGSADGGDAILSQYPSVRSYFKIAQGSIGGGGGGGGKNGGGSGGGTLTIIARHRIYTDGRINARGAAGWPGGGGGAGGIVTLIGENRARNFGTIDVSGGDGGDSSISDNVAGAPGGGGAAGIVYFVSATVRTGNIVHDGGDAGQVVSADASSAYTVVGGGAGGGLIKAGGNGGSVNSSTIGAAYDGYGGDGVYQLQTAPSSLTPY